MIHDESLYSFIYRTQWLKGFMQTQNLITLSGNWKAFPQVIPALIPYYKNHHEKELITLLNASGVISRENYWLNPLFYFQESLEHIFFSTEKIIKSSRVIPILFCHECIKESIYNNGFGYFKTEWLFYDYCKIHKDKLFRIIEKSNNEGIRYALSGIIPPSHTTKNHQVNLRKKPQPKIAPYALTACFFSHFERWLAHNHLHLPLNFYIMMAERGCLYLFDIIYTKFGTYTRDQ